jgi:2-phospho-L-lactate/phosphoenolpyruvate guanylyltransferase
MTFSIIIPVRPPEEGKTRLASVLDVPARAALVDRMFRHVLAVAVQSVPAAQVHVVSRSPVLLQLARECAANGVEEDAGGHIAALVQASAAVDQGAPVLALSADLPLVSTADIAAMVEKLGQADVVAATDRAGIGTNALLVRRPGLMAYAFGEGSHARHRQQADALGLRFAVVQREGLSFDVDEPGDLALLYPSCGASNL